MKHTIVTGLSFGDEGKGATVDYLAHTQGQRAPVVARYNGGPQAAHHVVSPEGSVHCFAQFGAGSLHPGCRTILTRFMLVEPFALMREAEALRAIGVSAPTSRLTIDRRCVLVTPYHRALNRAIEVSRGDARHGSCGLGVGQAWLDHQYKRSPSLYVGDVEDPARLLHRIEQQRLSKLDLAEQICDDSPESLRALEILRDRSFAQSLADRLVEILTKGAITRDEGESLTAALANERVIFEGAQGVLLDAEHGFFPHVTATRTTTHNANILLDEAGAARSDATRLGILRAYNTRHGAGPFPTESLAMSEAIPDWHNGTNPWQGAWRVGDFDAVLARYALSVCPDIDSLVITNLDRLDNTPHLDMATRHGDLTTPHLDLPEGRDRRDALTTLGQQLCALPTTTRTLPGWKHATHEGKNLSPNARAWLDTISEELSLPVSLATFGPTRHDKFAIR